MAVAFLVSSTVMIVGSGLLVGIIPFLAGADAEHRSAAFCVAYCGSIAGVFMGSLCLARGNRRLASVALSILGVVFYFAWCAGLKAEISSIYGGPVANRPLLFPLALGALSAVFVVILSTRKTRTANPALQRMPGSASVSKPDVSGPAPLS